MAISFVGSKTYSAAGANSGTFSVSLTDLKDTAGNNATLAQGDLLIITNVVGGTTDKGSANLLASGWTGTAPSDGTGQYANSTNDTNLQVQYKVMGATPDTTVSIPNSGSTADAVAGTVLAIRSSASGPASASGITGTGTGRPNPPSVTPSVAGSWIVVCGGAAAGVGAAFTNPGDLSSTTNHFRSVSSADTVDAMAGCGIKTDWTSGSFDPAQWTGGTTGGTDSWAAVTLVIEPAPEHPTSGALTGQIGAVAGSAARTREHAATGDLAGQGSEIVGSAARATAAVSHDTVGDLTGQLGSLAGDAARFRAFATSGALVGQGPVIDGAATRTAAPVTHDTSGVLVGESSMFGLAALRARGKRFRNRYRSSGRFSNMIWGQ